MKLVGQVLGGRYEVRREIARGGMGAVLEAHDRRLDRLVAIKAALVDEPAARLRLVDEAQVTGRLAHPSIVSVFELGAEGERPFLVMKLVAGRTLAKIAREPLEGDALRRRLRLFLRVAEAVAAAHDLGVIHRDLKPANVMIGQDDEVLVMDWGLARPFEARGGKPAVRSAVREALARGEVVGGPDGARAGDLTVEGAVIGTPAYMPPEQADAHVLDARADVYSLGATLYELLGGAAPYEGSMHEVLYGLFNRPPRPLRELAPAVPEPVAAIVERAMGREAKDRYPHARALAADLEAFLDERPVSCWRETPLASARRLARRHRAALVAACGALVLVVAGGAAAWQNVRARARTAEAERGRAEEALTRATDALTAARRALGLRDAAGQALDALRDGLKAVDAARRVEPLTGIETRHAAARKGLDEARAALMDQEAAAAEAGMGPLVSDLTTALVEARRRADLALGHALVARAPAASIERLQALGAADEALRPDIALLLGRALARAGRAPEARAALAELARGERADLRAAARALDLDLTDAPHAQRAQAWDDAVKALPRAGWASLGQAEALAGAGDLAKAEDAYERAQRLDPTDAWAVVSRIERCTPPCRDGEVLGGWLSLHPLLTDELPAVVHLQHEANLWRGIDRRPAPADLRELARALSLDEKTPREQVAAAGIGWARVLMRFDLALTFSRALLQRAPGNQDGVRGMAWALAGLERWDEVDRFTAEHLKRLPEDPELQGALGRALRARGRAAEALPHLELAARPSLDAARWVDLARCCLDAGEPARALVAAHRAAALAPAGSESAAPGVELSPRDPRVQMCLGDALAATGDRVRAALHHVLAWQQSYLFAEETGRDLVVVGLMEAAADHEALGLIPEARILYKRAEREPGIHERATARLHELEGR